MQTSATSPQMSSRVHDEAGRQLGVEVRRLLRHAAAGIGDGEHLVDGRAFEQEGERAVPTRGRDRFAASCVYVTAPPAVSAASSMPKHAVEDRRTAAR